MLEIIKDYRCYLEKDCRFTRDTVVNYLGNLPIILDNLEIQSVNDIDSRKISNEWRYSRWEETGEGIRLSESAQNGYLSALKEFLRYLEEKQLLSEKGISDIINLPGGGDRGLNGLAPAEQKKLREYLMFNVANDAQRRDTAMISLLLNSGCRLNELLALDVGPGGSIQFNESHRCGDFELVDGAVYAHIRGLGSAERKFKVNDEVMLFLNFYLENRGKISPILFLNNSVGGRVSRLTEKSAIRIIDKVFHKAAIVARRENLIDILIATAKLNGVFFEEEKRQIVTLVESRNQAGSGPLKNEMADGKRPRWTFKVNRSAAAA